MLKKYSSVEIDLHIEHDAEMLYFSRVFWIWGGIEMGILNGKLSEFCGFMGKIRDCVEKWGKLGCF